jgi:carbonic anhydrase
MSFSWEPFGRTHQDDPQPAAPAPPAPPPAAAPEPARPAALPKRPARGLAVLTCMDCRIDPLGALGLSLGDAVVLRNAGATVSDDVLRSLAMAHEALGVRAVHVIAHTDCAAHGGDDDAAIAEAVDGAGRIEAVLPSLRAQSGLLDLATGSLR